MPTKTLTRLKNQAIELARRPSLNFFELAEHITTLHNGDPALISDIPDRSGISRRRLYYLLEVGHLIATHKIEKSDAEGIGWTKLQIIARHLKASGEAPATDVQSLFKMASETRVHALTRALRSEKLVPSRSVLFLLDDKARSELNLALVAFGATQARRGLSGKQAALMKIVRAAMIRKR